MAGKPGFVIIFCCYVIPDIYEELNPIVRHPIALNDLSGNKSTISTIPEIDIN